MRVWHPLWIGDDDPADGGGEQRLRFEVVLRDVPVWRLVAARCASWLPCACCRRGEWPFRVAWGRRDEDGVRAHSLGAWWWRVYNRLNGLDLPPRYVRLSVSEVDLARIAGRFVTRAYVERRRDLQNDADPAATPPATVEGGGA